MWQNRPVIQKTGYHNATKQKSKKEKKKKIERLNGLWDVNHTIYILPL